MHLNACSSKLKAGSRKALRRNLLDAPLETIPSSSSSSSSSSSAEQQQQEDQGAVDYKGMEENAAAAGGGEVPQYPAAAFDLPAAAVQAAALQVQELQQMLAAQRVPRVKIEKVGAFELSRKCCQIVLTGSNVEQMLAQRMPHVYACMMSNEKV
jgi:hypothetical protein